MLRIIEAAAAISDPIRRRVLELVRDRELPAGELAAAFDVSRPAVSRHLRVLREAGLVSERREGTRRLYRAVRDQLGPLEPLLRDFWRADLEQLGRVIERDRSEGSQA